VRTLFIIGLTIYAIIIVYANFKLNRHEGKHRYDAKRKSNNPVRSGTPIPKVDFARAARTKRASSVRRPGGSTERTGKDKQEGSKWES
jgi:hypothetical protein